MLDLLSGVGFSAANWRPLGRRLKPGLDLDAIEADHPHEVRRCLEEVISRWQKDGEDPSWKTLAEAVSLCIGDSGGKNVAKKMRQRVGLGDFKSDFLLHIQVN